MKSNLELAEDAGAAHYVRSQAVVSVNSVVFTCDELDRFAALIRAEHVKELLGVKVEPVAWQWRRRDEPWSLERTFNSQVFATTADSDVRSLYTAEQCAAMVAQAMPKRLSREQVDAALDAASISLHRFADAIQDALGVKEQP